MRTTLLLFLCLLHSFHASLAKDFFNASQKITVNTSLFSAGQRFALGFFSPPGSPAESYYLGIWYQSQDSETRTVAWVASRDKPVAGSNGVFQIAGDGNLVVTDTSGDIYWSSKLKGSSSTNRTVKLMDSGNLVLFQDDHRGMSCIWQSFQHPTDTFLPGMKMDTNLELTSWRDESDPRGGNFTFKMAQTGDNYSYIIMNNHKLYWESGKNRELKSASDFDAIAYLLSNFSSSTTSPVGTKGPYEIINKKTVRPMNYENTRLLMNSTGQLQFLTRDSFQGDWSIHWKAPTSFCDSYNACGNFSSCNDKNENSKRCKCLPGFSQVSERRCARKSAAAASSCGEGRTRFLTLVMVKMGNPDVRTAANESDCENKCLKMCPQCQAYSYAAPVDTTLRDIRFPTCWIWTQDLSTVQELDDDYARNLSVRIRVDISDIAPTPKTCEPCGTNIVPYPLSTGSNCGDPMYFTFSCNRSTGQLSFIPTAPGVTYTIISVDAVSRKFIIQVNSSETYCSERSRNDETLQISFPFNVTNGCRAEDEVEVTWQTPTEPICVESVDCEGWNHSTCQNIGDGKRCLCNSNYYWDGVSLNCTNKEAISIPNKEPKASKGNSKSQTSMILWITLTSVVILACAIIFAYLCRRKITHKKGKENIQKNRGRFYDSERHVKDLIEIEGLEEKDNEGIEVPYFDFERILAATDNFSDANKLGQGGYGPVYKGKLQDGEVIAVKRLSSVSSQGLQEFKNEVVLIAKLQH